MRAFMGIARSFLSRMKLKVVSFTGPITGLIAIPRFDYEANSKVIRVDKTRFQLSDGSRPGNLGDFTLNTVLRQSPAFWCPIGLNRELAVQLSAVFVKLPRILDRREF